MWKVTYCLYSITNARTEKRTAFPFFKIVTDFASVVRYKTLHNIFQSIYMSQIRCPTDVFLVTYKELAVRGNICNLCKDYVVDLVSVV